MQARASSPKPGGLSKRDDDEERLGRGVQGGVWRYRYRCRCWNRNGRLVRGGRWRCGEFIFMALGDCSPNCDAPAEPDGMGLLGICIGKGAQGGERRDADRCASDTNRVPGGVRTMDMPRPAAAHALKSRSERQRRRGGQEPPKSQGGGAEGRCIALTVVMGCCGCTAVTPCSCTLHVQHVNVASRLAARAPRRSYLLRNGAVQLYSCSRNPTQL